MECKDCRYGHSLGSEETECRRLPPIVQEDYGFASFPVVKPTWWCGEYKYRYEANKDE